MMNGVSCSGRKSKGTQSSTNEELSLTNEELTEQSSRADLQAQSPRSSWVTLFQLAASHTTFFTQLLPNQTCPLQT